MKQELEQLQDILAQGQIGLKGVTRYKKEKELESIIYDTKRIPRTYKLYKYLLSKSSREDFVDYIIGFQKYKIFEPDIRSAARNGIVTEQAAMRYLTNQREIDKNYSLWASNWPISKRFSFIKKLEDHRTIIRQLLDDYTKHDLEDKSRFIEKAIIQYKITKHVHFVLRSYAIR